MKAATQMAVADAVQFIQDHGICAVYDDNYADPAEEASEVDLVNEWKYSTEQSAIALDDACHWHHSIQVTKTHVEDNQVRHRLRRHS